MKHTKKTDKNEPEKFVRPPNFTTKIKNKKQKKQIKPLQPKQNGQQIPKQQKEIIKNNKNVIQNQVNECASSKKNKKKLKNSLGDSGDFREKLVENLKGSRFRFINELLYTRKGEDAIKIFKEDLDSFQTYHDGYRKQVEQWPINPLDRIIKSVKALPKTYVVADFGCGEGRLARSVPQKCYSLDLVAARSDIIACDMAHTPLTSDSVNVVVFCLSLMGTNLKDFLLEANRVLKDGGHLKIAEVESRIDNVRKFIENVQQCGFKLASQDISTKIFYFLYFRKVRSVDNQSKVSNFALKPCLYKKR